MGYPGGKMGAGVFQAIINHIPPHDIYVEAFLGGGAIMLMKRPARSSIGIDIDAKVIKTFSNLATLDLVLLQVDAIRWLELQKFTPSTFIYIDPPYLMHTRSRPERIYTHEINEGDHKVLLDVIRKLKGMVMISGYPNAMYDDALSRWTTATFMTTNRGGQHVTEKIWMNYPPPIQLHDYRYLGDNFRERERIKKKKKRWQARLLNMPDLERLALAAAIAEISEPGHPRQIRRTAPAVKTDYDLIFDDSKAYLKEIRAFTGLDASPTTQDPITVDGGTRSPKPSIQPGTPKPQHVVVAEASSAGKNHKAWCYTARSRKAP
jgi:hypothetical protein